MKRYQKYKPSGIEWLGDIPEHWEVKRVKDIFQQINDISSDLKEGTYVPLENIESLTGRLIKRTSNDNGEITTLFKRGDILLNKLRPYLAKVLLADFDGGVSGEVIVYRTNVKYTLKINSGYYFYRFLSQEFISKINSITDGVKMPRSNPNKIFALDIQFPPLPEQTAIANYLDTKTAAIDHKIELLTAKANKYKALRRSLINETVCRGLNPNAPLKDSGIEWIGMIPEYWEVKRFKDIAYSITGLTYSPDDIVDEDDGILVLRSGNIQNGALSFVDNVFVNCNIGKNQFVRKGDILLCSRNGSANLVGKSAYIDKNYNYTWGAFMTMVRSKMDRFLFYALNSDLFKRNMGLFQTSTVNQLTSKMLDNMSFLVPSKREQVEIVEYLDNQTTQINTILINISEQIGKLTQLRKTLINDVVTGKIKVTE